MLESLLSADSVSVSGSDWAIGISLSVLASIVGAASKLAIRKSWLLQKAILSTIAAEAGDAARTDERLEENRPTESSIVREEDASRNERMSADRWERRLQNFTTTSLWERANSIHLWPAYALRFGGMMGMSIFNPLCGVIAMNYASPSILAPFSGLTLVWIIVLSDSLIQEPASRQQIAAATLIVTGEIIVSIFGDHTNDKGITIDDVVRTRKLKIIGML